MDGIDHREYISEKTHRKGGQRSFPIVRRLIGNSG